MANQEDIANLLERLAIHRRTLAHYLKQQSLLGSACIPPGVTHGITEARTEIARIKNTLRDWGVSVEDHPDDHPDNSGVKEHTDSAANPKPGEGGNKSQVQAGRDVNQAGRDVNQAGRDAIGRDAFNAEQVIQYFIYGQSWENIPNPPVPPSPSPHNPEPFSPIPHNPPVPLPSAPDPALTFLKAKHYHTAMELLEPRARDGEQAAARILGEIVEMAAVPFAYRNQAARVLAEVGDPRPGVCTLPLAMVTIARGTFIIGNPKEKAKYDHEINSKPVEIATFEISRYLITNAQYQLFIDDGGYNPNRVWWDKAGRAWLQRDDQKTEGLNEWQIRQHKDQPAWWNNERFGIANPNFPVVSISWYEAVAYCRWLTLKLNDEYIYRLPTEAEWEYAARRDTRRIYPWGDEKPDEERANYEENYKRTTAVGLFPKGATPDGIYDLAGNVWEWTGSLYKAYPYDPNDGREDLSNPANSTLVLRGGGWLLQSDYLRASSRLRHSPDTHSYLIGFRLARHLP